MHAFSTVNKYLVQTPAALQAHNAANAAFARYGGVWNALLPALFAAQAAPAAGINTHPSAQRNAFGAAVAAAGQEHAWVAQPAADASGGFTLPPQQVQQMRNFGATPQEVRTGAAQIHIDMHNENHLASNMDIDAVIGYLNAGVLEALETTAEGVYR